MPNHFSSMLLALTQLRLRNLSIPPSYTRPPFSGSGIIEYALLVSANFRRPTKKPGK